VSYRRQNTANGNGLQYHAFPFAHVTAIPLQITETAALLGILETTGPLHNDNSGVAELKKTKTGEKINYKHCSCIYVHAASEGRRVVVNHNKRGAKPSPHTTSGTSRNTATPGMP
jgi:hypothetical protein